MILTPVSRTMRGVPSRTGLPDWMSQAFGADGLHVAGHIEHERQVVHITDGEVTAHLGVLVAQGATPLARLVFLAGGVDDEIRILQGTLAVGGAIEGDGAPNSLT